MAKSLLRLEARKLRKKGISVKKIAEYLHVSKSSASIWVRDIIMSIDQLEDLKKASLEGSARGRIRNAFLQKEKWQKNMEEFKRLGQEIIGNLNDRELLITGLALYWGEGSKKDRRVQFCNSDPIMIQFLIKWLKRCFDIKDQEIRCRVGINEIHKKRDSYVKDYWSKITGISIDQFTKTSFKKVNNKKIYENFNNYYGTLSVEVKHPSRFYAKIIGLIDGLSKSIMI